MTIIPKEKVREAYARTLALGATALDLPVKFVEDAINDGDGMSKIEFTEEQQAERKKLALFGTYEIESIGMHLRDNLPNEQEYGYMRCMVLRILDLNSIATSELDGDMGRDTDEMRRVLEGC